MPDTTVAVTRPSRLFRGYVRRLRAGPHAPLRGSKHQQRPQVNSSGGRSLSCLAESHWEIENQGFNDAKNRYDLEHICHHYANSLLLVWLITCLALIIERLYRLRHLDRGAHPVRSAIGILRLSRLSLAISVHVETS